jgi:MFS family permease
MYNSVIPLMLTNTFHMNETISGVIMAADNVLALFLLPIFGTISDRCRHPWGKRMPFIVFGTIAAVLLMVVLPMIDDSYAAGADSWKIAAFVAVLLALLVAMGTYRSPAVALMPDLTPKPLRSRGNAIINLMGAVGGILYLAIAAVLYGKSRTAGLDHVSVAVVFLTIREPAIEHDVAEYEAEHPEENLTEKDESGNEVLPKPVRRSLTFLLVSIALWFIGYNAMETWFTTYAAAEWGMALGDASRCLIVANLGAIASYIPVGHIAGKVGRKRTILVGICMLGGGFAFCAAWTFAGGGFSPVLYAVMVVLGMGWAAINVNSLPMVVEMCKGSDIGKFTGYYYTFSMAAQTVTPIVAGWLMANVSYRSLFVYATVFVFASFVTMQSVHHGDTTNIEKRGLESFDAD